MSRVTSGIHIGVAVLNGTKMVHFLPEDGDRAHTQIIIIIIIIIVVVIVMYENDR
jgi:hypothetical protein